MNSLALSRICCSVLACSLSVLGTALPACSDAVCPMGTTEVGGHCRINADAATADDSVGAGTAASTPAQAVTGDTSGARASPIGAAASAGTNAASSGPMQMDPSSGAALAGAGGTSTSAAGKSSSTGGMSAMPMAGSGANTPGGCVASVEECNGVDDDCDTSIDEHVTRPCGSAVGECEPGTLTCQNGTWPDEKTDCVGGRREQPEACDAEMRDENCDGSANEGCACSEGQIQACGESATLPCKRGMKICVNGKWPAECQGAVNPMTEQCDGVDNDCNGTVDDGRSICPTGRVCGGADGCVACRTAADCAEPGTCKVKYCDTASHTCVPRNADTSVRCDRGHCDNGQCVECSSANDCDDKVCQTKSCSSGTCRYSAVPQGQRQSCPSGQVCSARSVCVDCVTDSDCGSAEECTANNTCRRKPAVCGDGTAETAQGESCDPGKGEGVGTFTCSAECKPRNLYSICDGTCPDPGTNCYASMCVPSSCPRDLPDLDLFDDAGYCMVLCTTASDCPSPFSQCATIGDGRTGCFL